MINLPAVSGLLYASRQTYAELSAAIFQNVALGSEPVPALRFLESIGDWRIPQLALDCKCWDSRDGTPQDDWNPVLDYLESRGARFRTVKIDNDHCWNTVCVTLPPPAMQYPTCNTQCEADSSFWATLARLGPMTTEKFTLGSEMTEYLVHRFGLRLGWPRALVGFRPYVAFGSQPKLEITNPKFLNKTTSNAVTRRGRKRQPRRPKQTIFFWHIPVEIRQQIYDHAFRARVLLQEWPVYPRCINLGVGLLSTCKQIAAEARPLLYRDIDIIHISPAQADAELELFRDYMPWVRSVTLHFTSNDPARQEGSEHLVTARLGPGYQLRQLTQSSSGMRTLAWAVAPSLDTDRGSAVPGNEAV